MQATFKGVVLWLSLLAVILLAWHFAQAPHRDEGLISFTEMVARVEEGDPTGIIIRPRGAMAEFWLWSEGGGRVHAIGPITDGVLEQIRKSRVPVEYQTGVETQTSWSNVLISFAPFILLIGFWIFFMKKMGTGLNVNDAKKAIAVRLDKEPSLAGTLVGAAAAALPELRVLTTAERPAAVLVVGPSGSGKTRLLRALAAGLQRPCLWSEGSSFVWLFMGLGVARIQDLLARAKKDKAAFVAIDAIDDVCRLRIAESRAERDERHQTMQALIAAIDEWRAKPTFAFIGVTNRPDLIDDAILRRFDRVLTLGAPDAAARETLICELLRDGAGLDVSGVVARTDGWMPSDLEAMAQDAARRAAGRQVSAADVDAALTAREEVRALVTRVTSRIAS